MPNKPPSRQTSPPRKAWQHDKTADERGYTWGWRCFSRRFKAEQPLCELCLAAGKVEATRSVHHIAKVKDAPERLLERVNVIALCDGCHLEADRNPETNQRCRAIAEAREASPHSGGVFFQ